MNSGSNASIPPDDLRRNLAIALPDVDQTLPHIALAGDTYTLLLTGKDTAGHFTVIDMHIPDWDDNFPVRRRLKSHYSTSRSSIATA